MTGGNFTAAALARSGALRSADWRYRLAVGWREPTAAIVPVQAAEPVDCEAVERATYDWYRRAP